MLAENKVWRDKGGKKIWGRNFAHCTTFRRAIQERYEICLHPIFFVKKLRIAQHPITKRSVSTALRHLRARFETYRNSWITFRSWYTSVGEHPIGLRFFGRIGNLKLPTILDRKGGNI